jgi:lipopolysaccharide export system protein LptA
MKALLLFASLAAASANPLRAVEIKADRLEILGKTQKAVWTGNVRATRGETKLRCDRLVAHYNRAREVTRIECTGLVEVIDKDKWAKGERAQFDNATGVLELTGSPEARQGANHLRGTKVVFTAGADVLRVDNARTVLALPKPKPEGRAR